MFDFYNTFYKMEYLTKNDIKKAALCGIISPDDYKKIIGEEYSI